MYLIVSEDGLQLWRVEEDGENVFTGVVFPRVKAAHSYVFGNDGFLGLPLAPGLPVAASNRFNGRLISEQAKRRLEQYKRSPFPESGINASQGINNSEETQYANRRKGQRDLSAKKGLQRLDD